MKRKYPPKSNLNFQMPDAWRKNPLPEIPKNKRPFADLFNEPLPTSEMTDEQKDHFEQQDEITRGMRAVSGGEDKLQKVCREWLETYLEKNEIDCVFNHTANQSNGYKGSNARAMGYHKGYPDLFIAYAKKKVRIHPELFGQERREETIIACGLFIELKTPKGRIKPEQITTHESLRKQGYQVEVVRDYETFKQIVISYLNDN